MNFPPIFKNILKNKMVLVMSAFSIVIIGSIIAVLIITLKGNPELAISASSDNSKTSSQSVLSQTSSEKASQSSSILSSTSSSGLTAYSPIPNSILGYTAKMILKDELDDFEYGINLPYNRDPYNQHPELVNSSPHYWSDVKPEYSYTSSVTDAKKLNYGATTNLADNCNFWYVYPEVNKAKGGYVDAIYVTNLPNKDNFEILELYQKLYVTYNGINSDGKNVNLTISAFSNKTQKWYDLTTFTGQSNKKTIIECDLTKIPNDARLAIQFIRFRTFNKDISTNSDGSSYQKNELFGIIAKADTTFKTKTATVGNITFDSEYLGNVKMTRWGAYSASGFYDSSDKKWKIWYGAGVPEGTATDNVYYMETLDPQKDFTKPQRLIINDPNKVLIPYNQPPGYGGDPSVIKVNGTYYMYFSKIDSNPKSKSYWFNKIFLATSTDGKNFTVYDKPIVDGVDGGKAGYGSGSPSVVYKDGTYYMYYYSQYEEPGGYFLRTSTDGKNFGAPIRTGEIGGDVVYVPSMKKWLMCYYTEAGQGGNYSSAGVRIGVSDDGKNWIMGNDDSQFPSQNPYPHINHNPGWIRDPQGFGYKSMFLTYGYNDLPLVNEGTQMDSRQIEWSRVFFK